MTDESDHATEARVLVLPPTAKDAELVRTMLEGAGVRCEICGDMRELCDLLAAGASAVLLPEEAVTAQRHDRLLEFLENQPHWSDIPLLVLARPGADSESVARAMDLLGNVTVLERPMRVSSLVSAVRSALRARRRQYQIREHLVERARSEEALRMADRRKDEFLAILAHELRNPLAPIRSSLCILQRSCQDDPTARRVGEMMERQVLHMVRLVDDLLEVSRITRGKIALRSEEVDLARVVDHAVDTSRPLIDAAKHALRVDLPAGDPIALQGDEVRLAQVFSNLLNNAAKYTDEGGTVELRARRDDDEVVIAVRDNGKGIPPAMISRVFDLFTQVDGSENRTNGGLGIGLTLVKTLVELHHGTIEARSEGIGQGSEFIVRLPAKAGAKAGTQRGSGSVSPSPPVSRPVLIVDDNRDAAETLAILLRLLGSDVRVTSSGREALQLLDAFTPDVILLDIGMPGMDGYEVARRIRAREDGASFTLVALTGWGQDEDRARSSSAGFDHHLVKPADLQEIQALLASLPSGGMQEAASRERRAQFR